MAQKNVDESSRELLLAAGMKVFAKMGFDGATIRQIADEAGVNVSLVSYYFQGKEGLFRAVVEPFAHSRLETAKRILQKPISREEFRVRLEMFIAEILRCHKEQPEIIQIINREFELGIPGARDIFEATFLEIFKRLCRFFREALDAGFLKKNVDPSIAATALFGSIKFVSGINRSGVRFFKNTITDANDYKLVVDQFMIIFFDGLTLKKGTTSTYAEGFE